MDLTIKGAVKSVAKKVARKAAFGLAASAAVLGALSAAGTTQVTGVRLYHALDGRTLRPPLFPTSDMPSRVGSPS